MNESRAYQSIAAAGAALGMPSGKFAAANSLPDKVAEIPRLDSIANQFKQANECLRVLTNRAGNVADRLMGNRPPMPSGAEEAVSPDHSATHRLQRQGSELFATLELLAVEIQRLEEL